MPANSLQDLYVQKLQMIMDAEQQTLQAMPQMTQMVSNEQLRSALQQHERQTQGQVERLQQLMQQRGQGDGQSTQCISMRALIEEAQQMLPNIQDPDTIDAFIIGAQQAVEHHEIAAYGTVRTWAQQLGFQDDADLLQQTLDEEGQADKMLSSIAEQNVNQRASQGADREVSVNSGGQGDMAESGVSGGRAAVNAERGADMR